MGKLLSANGKVSIVEKILVKAKKKLVLVAPSAAFRDVQKVLQFCRKTPGLKVIIVCGATPEPTDGGSGEAFLSWFASYPNIEIRYDPTLQDEFYANENVAALYSINLARYGVEKSLNTKAKGWLLFSRRQRLAARMGLRDTLEGSVRDYLHSLIIQSELIYLRTPRYTSTDWSFRKKYTHSITEIDHIEKYFFKVYQGSGGCKSEAIVANGRPGFCIRTGVQIPFNSLFPFSEEAYWDWANCKDSDFPEKYCHFSGEISHGESTFENPILQKNIIEACAYKGD